MLTRLIRLRLARSPRSLRAFNSAPHSEPPSITPLSSLHLPDIPVHPFPLYRSPPPPAPYPDLPTSLDGLPSDKSLQIRQKQKLTRAVEAGVEEYTEDQLREFYAAVVQSGEELLGVEGQAKEAIAGPSRLRGVEGPSAQRSADRSQQTLARLGQRFGQSSVDQADPSAENMEMAESHVDIREIIDGMIRFVEEEEEAAGSSSSGVSRGVQVPLGIISRAESNILLQESVRQGDATALVALLETLPRLCIPVEREQISEVLSEMVRNSRGALGEGEEEVAMVLSSIIGQQADLLPAEQDALVRVQLRADQSGTTAISHLRHFESLSRPAPQSTYNLVLHHLTNMAPTSLSRSTAWDLFTHMRLVAHPLPTLETYGTMIRACAASSDPRPEMARDLWLQMTQEQNLDPAEPEYTAYIRALSSTRGTYLEGFDIFRQMLARHHEATYVPFEEEGGEEVMSRFVPTNNTWKALLEGAKRAGDLGRARWVLQEAVRLQGALGGQRGMGVDEDVMASLFMAYAAWKPVIRRIAVKESTSTVPNSEVGMEEQTELGSDATDLHHESDFGAEIENASQQQGMFENRLPTTSTEALREARLLFDAMISASDAASQSIFTDVRPTTRLINSFLSVSYTHATSISECRATWESVVPHLESEGRNGWSYLYALERCAIGQRSLTTRSSDRPAALEWAKSLWSEYMALSQNLLQRLYASPDTPGLAYSLGISPRQVERCWKAIIRVHALNDDTTTSLSLLNQFHELYPPDHILQGYSPTSDHGFSVRFTDPTTVAESDVPPHLLFKDVDVLHQRLVRDDKLGEVGRVKWICQSYEKALVKRRKWRLGGVGKGRERKKGQLRSISVEQREELGVGAEEYGAEESIASFM